MYDDWYKSAKRFIYHRGWPEKSFVESCLKNDGNNLLIFDDLEESVIKNTKASNQLMKLFTVYRHHWGVSVIWVTHHLFSKHDSNTCIQRNSQYLVLMSSPRDKSAIAKLGSQIDLGYGPFLLSAYKEAVKKAGDFLLLDLRSDTPEKYRVRETVTKEGCIARYK